MADVNGGMTVFVGFAPDEDPLTPGIWLDCDGLVGTKKGFRPEPGDEFAVGALPAIYYLYDRSAVGTIYDVMFSSVISVNAVTGYPGHGGILLNDGNILYINNGLLQFDKTPFGDVVPWDGSHTLYVDSSGQLVYVE